MHKALAKLSPSTRNQLREKEQPNWTQPMLATLVHNTFSDPQWLYERKLDGERCLVFVKEGEVGFTEWTADNKLRHPRFLGLRRDKKAEQVVSKEPA